MRYCRTSPRVVGPAITVLVLVIMACSDGDSGGPGAATTGAIQVMTSTSGSTPDPDGYEITVSGGAAQPMGGDATLTIPDLAPGPYSLELTEVAVNCSVGDDNPRAVNVVAGETVRTTFSVSCVAFATGKITFRSRRAGGNGLIFLMDGDGANVEQVTTGGSSPQQDFPNLSPDRSKILYTDWRADVPDPSADIYVVNADGSNVTRLTDDPAADWDAVWSPTGQMIAFQRDRGGGWEIYIMNADGSGVRRLTNGRGPDWSPEGGKISFFDDQDGNPEIYVINVDGSERTQLTENAAGDFRPAWSPDGDKIAFDSDRDGNFEIYIMDADGSNVVRLTDDPDFDSDATWSPDGLRIAFSSNRDGNTEIYAQHVDGAGLVQLTDEAAGDGTPHWR